MTNALVRQMKIMKKQVPVSIPYLEAWQRRESIA